MAQCSAGADHGHSTRAQWPVIPAVPCPGRYGVDATSCLIGHSAVSSRHSADIAGVVGALMGRDALLGRLVEAEAIGCCRAGLERYGESLSRSRLYARASGETENWFLVEASRARPRARRRFGRPSRPPVRGLVRRGEPVGSDNTGGQPMVYLLALSLVGLK